MILPRWSVPTDKARPDRHTWSDAFRRAKKYKKWQRVARIIIVISAVLLAMMIYFYERTGLLPLVAFALLLLAVAAYAIIYFAGLKPAIKDQENACDT